MKRLAFAMSLALLSASAAFSQAASKPQANAAGPGKMDPTANREKNIQAYIELLRQDVKTAKAQIMGEVMQLDADQATKFWPVYKQFEADYAKIGDQIVAAVRKYADTYDEMTDDVADDLAKKVLSIEQQRNELKQRYYERFKKDLGAITAARFLQVENQIERLLDLQISAELPVMSQSE